MYSGTNSERMYPLHLMCVSISIASAMLLGFVHPAHAMATLDDQRYGIEGALGGLHGGNAQHAVLPPFGEFNSHDHWDDVGDDHHMHSDHFHGRGAYGLEDQEDDEDAHYRYGGDGNHDGDHEHHHQHHLERSYEGHNRPHIAMKDAATLFETQDEQGQELWPSVGHHIH